MVDAILRVVGGTLVTTNNEKSADDTPHNNSCSTSHGGLTKTKSNLGDLDTIIEGYGRSRHSVSDRG